MRLLLLVYALLFAATYAACPLGHGAGGGRHLRNVFEGVEADDDYESMTAKEKQLHIASELAAHDESAPWPNPVQLGGLFTESMDVSVHHVSDTFPKSSLFQRMKLIHSVGYAAQIKVNWKPNPYTGLFQKADYGFLRLASAIQPNYKESDSSKAKFTPGFGMKFLRDGVPSGNTVALHKLTPSESWNTFAVKQSNHLSGQNLSSALSVVKKKFETAPTAWAGFVGSSDLARYGQDGTRVSDEHIKFPFQIIYHPDESLASAYPDAGTDLDLFTTQLQPLQAGQRLYKVYTKATYSSPEVYTGDIVMTTAFAPSSYGDQTMFLKHQTFEEDLKLRPDFLTDGCANDVSCRVCPVDTDC